MSGEIYINRGTNTRYIARVRVSGERKWTLLGKKRQYMSTAVSVMARTMIDDNWDVGEVLLVSDNYDPHVVFTARREY